MYCFSPCLLNFPFSPFSLSPLSTCKLDKTKWMKKVRKKKINRIWLQKKRHGILNIRSSSREKNPTDTKYYRNQCIEIMFCIAFILKNGKKKPLSDYINLKVKI